MAGCYGNDPFDQYWERELDQYLDSLEDGTDEDDNNEDDYTLCKNCGNYTLEEYYNTVELDDDNCLLLQCPCCGYAFNKQ